MTVGCTPGDDVGVPGAGAATLSIAAGSRYVRAAGSELRRCCDEHGRPVRFASPAYWKLQQQAFAARTAGLTRDGAIVVTVQIERSGLGMTTRCTPTNCGPFLKRLIRATAAQDTWNAFLASHRGGAVRSISIEGLVCDNAASPCNDRLPDGSLARPDGTHYSQEAAPTVAEAVIADSLAAADLPGAPVARRVG